MEIGNKFSFGYTMGAQEFIPSVRILATNIFDHLNLKKNNNQVFNTIYVVQVNNYVYYINIIVMKSDNTREIIFVIIYHNHVSYHHFEI